MTLAGRVAPLGNLRINGCSPLPTAYRSVPRPSSPLVAKASTKCPSHRLIAFRVRILKLLGRLDRTATQQDALTMVFTTERPAIQILTSRPDCSFINPDHQQGWCTTAFLTRHCFHPRPACLLRHAIQIINLSSHCQSAQPGPKAWRSPRPKAQEFSCQTQVSQSPASPFGAAVKELVELNGIEPMTSCLQSTRSPN